MKYTTEIEPVTHDADDSNFKQVEAKILDFNWVFIGNNNATFIKILAQTENDQIFACSQIRVYIEFMWEIYYYAIFYKLFMPFIGNILSFLAFTGYYAHYDDNNVSVNFLIKIICIVIYGKTYQTMLFHEIIQLRSLGITAYFFDI